MCDGLKPNIIEAVLSALVWKG